MLKDREWGMIYVLKVLLINNSNIILIIIRIEIQLIPIKVVSIYLIDVNDFFIRLIWRNMFSYIIHYL